MNVTVNGTTRELADDATVRDVLDLLDAPPSVAVAVDNAVVPRAAWSSRTLADGSVVEILSAVQGG
ncbi:sulfur carrier protein ThiS [Flindersiella endophytica]